MKALSDIRRVVADPGYTPNDPRELCNRIFVTVYMGTKNRYVHSGLNREQKEQKFY
jgi:hypothetical protein